MSYIGSFDIDDNLTFYATTSRFDTGNGTDADSAPTYRVYEEETATPLLTGSMALLDSTNTAGFYSEQIALTTANGFERSKCYAIYIAGTVNSVNGVDYRTFQVGAKVNTVAISGDITAADNLEAAADGTGYNLGGGSIVAASVTGAVGSVTGNVGGNVTGSVGSVAAGGITAASIATDAIDADALASDAVTEIQSGLSTLNAAGVRTAVGLASADMDTQLGDIQDSIDAISSGAASNQILITPLRAVYSLSGDNTLEVHVDDTPTVRVDLIDSTGTKANLQGATVTAVLRDLAQAQVGADMTGTLIDAIGGRFRFPLTDTHTATAGTYRLTFTVVNSPSTNVFGPLTLKVLP